MKDQKQARKQELRQLVVICAGFSLTMLSFLMLGIAMDNALVDTLTICLGIAFLIIIGILVYRYYRADKS